MIKAGGLKLQEDGACVTVTAPPRESTLSSGICAPLAQRQINLTLLGHLRGAQERGDCTILCTSRTAGPDSYALLRSRSQDAATVRLLSGACILSLYPHDKSPQVAGALLASLGRAGVMIQGLASSPAAVAAVISRGAKEAAIQALFEDFTFRAYQTPQEFGAVLHPPEKDVREVVASYQEKAPRIYCLNRLEDLELWEVAVPSSQALASLAHIFFAMGEQGARLPFLLALPGPSAELILAFCLPAPAPRQIEALLTQGEALRVSRTSPAAAFFTHGPHFGDRYGIANLLAAALQEARVPLLALSCAISSLSVVVPQSDAGRAAAALDAAFGAPHGG